MGIFSFLKGKSEGALKEDLKVAEENAKLWFELASNKSRQLDIATKALEFYAKKNDKNARTAKKALKEIAK